MLRKQQKNQSKLSKRDDEDTGPQELLERPKEYIVRLDTSYNLRFSLDPDIYIGRKIWNYK